MPGDTATLSGITAATPMMPVLTAPNARQAAAEAMTQAIADQEKAGKLSAPHAALLRRIVASPKTTEQQMKLLTEAMSHLGKEYNWGSAGPDQFDCSGLTLYVSHKVLGLDLPDTAAHQFETIPKHVERSRLQPGDLIYFGSKRITHVAIYLADNMMLEAGGEGQVSTPDGKVRIRTVRKDYKGARRVVADSPVKPPKH
jgi:cell wall-associated NlpC family hydrolase